MIPSIAPAKSYSLYQSYKELPLNLFIKCVVKDDYTVLIINGSCEPEELQEAWQSIYSEYCGLIGGSQITAFIRQIKQINLLHSKITRVTGLVECLKLMHSPELVECLVESGYKIAYTKADDPEYFRSLSFIEAQVQRDTLRLQQLEKELPKEEKTKATEEDFHLTLMEASKFEGYHITDNITTYQYCLHVQRLKKHIEGLRKNQDNGRRKNK